MTDLGLRERKKTETRQHLSDVATRLFAERGFDAVSVSEIADAADVSRPTVFAYFPRKEDLVFDRVDAVTATIARALQARDEAPIHAVRRLLVGASAPGGLGKRVTEQRAFWRLVAGSRALQSRARELAEHMEGALAAALHNRGMREPDLCAALIAATYRSIHLHAIRRVLDGDSARDVDAERIARLTEAFDALEHTLNRLQQPH